MGLINSWVQVLLFQYTQGKNLIFFFYLGFLSKALAIHRAAEKRGGQFFNSSLLLLSASQTVRHQPSNYCRELTSIHNQQPDTNQEPQVSLRKLLTTKLNTLEKYKYCLKCKCRKKGINGEIVISNDLRKTAVLTHGVNFKKIFQLAIFL